MADKLRKKEKRHTDCIASNGSRGWLLFAKIGSLIFRRSFGSR